MNYLKRIKNIFSNENNLFYDDLHIEARSTLVENNVLKGGRIEFLKTLSQNIQINNVCLLGESKNHFQFSGVYMKDKLLIMSSVDQQKNIQTRMSYSSNNLVTKINSMISLSEGVYTQLELEKRNSTNTVGIKAISPSSPSTGIVYVGNYLQSFKNDLKLGFEVIASKMGKSMEIGLSFGGRIEKKKSVTSFNIQQLTSLSLSHYRKLNDYFKIATDINVSPLSDKKVYGVFGVRLDTHRSTVKAEINSELKSSLTVEEKLYEGFILNMGVELDHKKSLNSFGIGFSFES